MWVRNPTKERMLKDTINVASVTAGGVLTVAQSVNPDTQNLIIQLVILGVQLVIGLLNKKKK